MTYSEERNLILWYFATQFILISISIGAVFYLYDKAGLFSKQDDKPKLEVVKNGN